ncbi:interferon-inducible GTPase-domain-containing protein [Scleroderma yunnanense]
MGSFFSSPPTDPNPRVVEQLLRMHFAELEARNAEERAREAKQAAEGASMLAFMLHEELVRLMEELQKMRKELAAQGRSAEETDQKTKSKEADIREISRREQEILRKIRIAEEVRRCSLVSTKPKDTPSPDEIKTMKQRIEYDEQLFHIAVVGLAGSGKSSLINAVRGLCNNSPDAAPTGVTEMTPEVKRYPPTNNQPVAWYDIPGAGTLSVPGWQYFRTQGLYVFDCIIVLMNERFTETDIAILDNCRQLKIPAYIVRSKADQHICNIISLEMGYGSDAEDDELENYYFQKHYKAARKQLIEQTSQSVKSNLKRANLPDQRVYIVSAKAIYSTVMNKNSQKTIDKIDLIKDLYLDAHENRGSDAQDMALWDLARWEGSFRRNESTPSSQSTLLPGSSES